LIITPDDAQQAERAVTQALDAWTQPMDGIILASFGDTGLNAVRSRTNLPVVGIAQCFETTVAR
jgi:Asp/Glu/hydantoin racemase